MPIQTRNTTTRWGAVAQLFHWTIVAMIIAQYTLANLAGKLPAGIAKLAILAQHKSVGITILVVAALRLLWRSTSRSSPALPQDLRPWERFLAHLTHHGLYLLLFALPLTGWIMSSAKNYPVSWFGTVRLPNLVTPSETLFGALKATHGILANALLALAALHLLAALQHQIVRRDDVLRRMLPFTAPGTRHGHAKFALAGAVSLALAWSAFRVLLPATAPDTPPLSADGSTVAPGAGIPGGAGHATSWTASPAESSLDFTFVQAGAATQGKFNIFSAAIDFTPGPMPIGRFEVSIDLASVDTQDRERNEQLTMTDLFDVARNPRATYVATDFVGKGTEFEARGQLQLRGVTRDVPLTFHWTPASDGKSAVLTGSAHLKRLEFGVGQGEWKSTEWIADEVQVNFRLKLVPPHALP